MGVTKTTILLVEDEVIVRKAYVRDLQVDRFAVTAVSSGSEAIHALAGGAFDVVIIDLVLPGGDGFQVLHAVKKMTPQASVIALTGSGDTQAAIDALRLGTDDFIRKPFESHELVFRIRHCLAKRNLLLEHKRAEAEKIRLKAQLIHSQKMEVISLLAGGIAHDFYNLLSLILGHAEIARHAVSPESVVAKKLDKVMEAGHRTTSLVKQILALGHQDDNNRMSLNPVYLVKEAIKLLRPQLPFTIAINQQINTGNSQIQADPAHVYQIFTNLCTNAVQSMEPTGGILNISLKDRQLSQEDLLLQPKVAPGEFVVFSVGDTGPGVAAEISGRIFDPYFTTKGVGKGTGMGLAIVHGIIKAYRGFITCESRPGEGAYFHVFFPAI